MKLTDKLEQILNNMKRKVLNQVKILRVKNNIIGINNLKN